MGILQHIKRYRAERMAMQMVKKMGIDQQYVYVTELGKQKFAQRESDGQEGDFYFYTGPTPQRDFCQYMMRLDKVLSSGEIVQLGQLLGYMSADGLDYIPGEIMPRGGPGGPNCKHRWGRFRGKIVLTPAPTENQIRTLIGKSVFE